MPGSVIIIGHDAAIIKVWAAMIILQQTFEKSMNNLLIISFSWLASDFYSLD
jgi:hypothetical protein